MVYLTIILIGIGLSMDALAVSVSAGLSLKEMKFSHPLRVGLFFGGFQAVMPLIGWAAGLSLKKYLVNVDHWVAFIILTFIGIKMIYEALRNKDEKKQIDYMNFLTLFLLAVATSIDALAVGLTFAFLGVSIFTAVLIIGAVTFSISFAGVIIGNRIGHIFENKIEIFGGLILIVIGIKILLEHIMK